MITRRAAPKEKGNGTSYDNQQQKGVADHQGVPEPEPRDGYRLTISWHGFLTVSATTSRSTYSDIV
jgi:hypothetical protein